MDKEFALITGASQGLGRAFAFELSQRKINTILVGLPNEGLDSLTSELRYQYEVESVYFETDLTKKENVLALAQWVNENFSVSMLINNAGVGGTKKFLDADVDYIDRIIQLNIMATALITHQLLPNLKKKTKAYILNVSSMAAFSPIGFKTVYPASKVFIHYFSKGLYQELAKTNVFVSVVNPVAMKTNKEMTERINNLRGIFGKIGILTPEKVAKISITQLFKRKTMIMLSLSNGFIWLLMKIVPIWIKLPLLTRAVRREIDL